MFTGGTWEQVRMGLLRFFIIPFPNSHIDKSQHVDFIKSQHIDKSQHVINI